METDDDFEDPELRHQDDEETKRVYDELYEMSRPL